MKTRLLLLLILWLGYGIALAGDSVSGAKPNIILILADDLGYGDPGVYNPDSRILTTHIDALASAGIRFSDAHSSGSTCRPSRYGLMTGSNPLRIVRSYDSGLIQPGTETLASLLKQSGYVTAAIGKWHLGMVGEKAPKPGKDLQGGPLDHGFDRFFGIPASLDIPPYYFIEGRRPVVLPTMYIPMSNGTAVAEDAPAIQGPFYRAGKMSPGFNHGKVLEILASEAIETIHSLARNQSEPFFLYLALPSPHTPWLPAEKFRGTSGAGPYGDYVLQVDDIVGRVISVLESLAIAENTMVIFSSDNGPVWYPENVKEFGHSATGGLSGMKGDVTEGGHRIPLIVRWPAKIQAAGVNDSMISLTDTLATFADIAGTKIATDVQLDSISYYPQLVGKQVENVRHMTIRAGMTGDSGSFSIRNQNWKLITGKGYGGLSDRYDASIVKNNPFEGRLYDLKTDLAEQHNLYGKHPEIVEGLSMQLEQFLQNTGLTKSPLGTPDT